MKLSLTVQTPGKWEKKQIPITLSQFLIGRDPQCHLRPANPIISKRHCVIVTREDHVFIRDLNSTNGTYVNDTLIKGEHELVNGDQLSIGPLQFVVQMEVPVSVPVNEHTPSPMPAIAPAPRLETQTPPPVPPPPPPARAGHADEESVAAMLLSLQDTDTRGLGDPPTESDGVPPGSTVLDVLAPTSETAENQAAKDKQSKHDAAKAAQADTSAAAKVILDKYLRRPRT
jgi:pSer/pThr/pTyr-binding forkhead associated (FHA) protein